MATNGIPATPDEIAKFIKTATIDDIMKVSMKMRQQVEALKKSEEKLQKKQEKELERREKKELRLKEKEEEKRAKEEARLAKKLEKMMKKSKVQQDSDDEDISSDDDEESHVEVVKRKVGRPRKEKPEKTRKPRAPTAYNLFLKEKILEYGNSHPELTTQERMKLAVNEWNLRKNVAKNP